MVLIEHNYEAIPGTNRVEFRLNDVLIVSGRADEDHSLSVIKEIRKRTDQPTDRFTEGYKRAREIYDKRMRHCSFGQA